MQIPQNDTPNNGDNASQSTYYKDGGDSSATKNIRKTIEINTLDMLNHKNFLNTDMNKFSAKVVSFGTKLFGPTEYNVEIRISNIPPFKIPKRYQEFNALRATLKMKYKNVKWPEFPNSFQIMNKNESRKIAFNKLLETIIELTKEQNTHTKSLLGIFYAFFLDNDIAKKFKDQALRNKSTTKNNKEEEDEDEDSKAIEEAIQKKLQEFDAVDDPQDKQNEEKPKSLENNSLLNSPGSDSLLNSSPKIQQPQFNESEEVKGEKVENLDNLENSSEMIENEETDLLVDNQSEANNSKFTTAAKTDAIVTPQKKGIKGIFNKFVKKKPKDSPSKEAEKTVPMDIDTHIQDTISKLNPVDNQVYEKQKDPISSQEIFQKQDTEMLFFCGELYMKMEKDKTWTKYFARMSDCLLLLYKSIMHNYPVHTIGCYSAKVEYIEKSEFIPFDMIEISHFYDNEKLQFCVDPSIEDQNDQKDPHKNLKIWSKQFSFMTHRTRTLDFGKMIYNVTGKCQLVILDAKGLKGIPVNSACYIKVSHIPYTMRSFKFPAVEKIEWRQGFFLPTFDPFFPITLELVAIYTEGWLSGAHKEEVICSTELLTPDIISMPRNATLTFKLNMKFPHEKKKLLMKILNLNNDSEFEEPVIRVKVKNLSSLKSFFVPSTKNYIEGLPIDHENYNKQYMKLGFKRIYRLISFYKIFRNHMADIYNWKYPIFSFICFALFTFGVLRFDVSTALQDFILFLVILSIYKAPPIYNIVRPIFDKYLFADSELNPLYRNPIVTTLDEEDIKKCINTSKWNEKNRDAESIITTFKKAKKSLAVMTVILHKWANFFEKLKNLIVWQDPVRSWMFITFLMFLYCGLSIIGLRVLYLLNVWMSFYFGLGYYKNIYKKNKDIARIALHLVLQNHAPEHFEPISKNPENEWPVSMNINSFQRKIIERFQYRLSIKLPEDPLVQYKTPESFLDAVSTCPSPLILQLDLTEEMQKEQQKKKDPTFSFGNIFNFLDNVPSDYFRILHPKMKSE